MQPAAVAAVLAEARSAIVAQAAKSKLDLTPWFESNARTLMAMGQMLALLIERKLPQSDPKPPKALAEEALDTAARLVAVRFPTEAKWFERNRRLLLWIALSFATLLLGQAQAAATPAVPPAASAPDRTEAVLKSQTRSEPQPAAKQKSSQEEFHVEPLEEFDELEEELLTEIEAAAHRIVGKEPLIRTYLEAQGLDEAVAESLARLDAATLAERLVSLALHRRQRDAQAARTLAGEINQLGNNKPALLLAQRNQSWESVTAEDLPPLLSAAASVSTAAVAALVSGFRYYRPDLNAALQATLQAEGRLSPRGDALWTGPDASTSVGLADASPATVRKLWGERIAAALRVVPRWIEPVEELDPTRLTGPLPPSDLPPDLRSPADRTRANIAAIQIVSRGTSVTPEELAIVRQYSGWGGLSLKGLDKVLSPDWIPESRALIHEYYTPTKVARAIAEAVRPRLGRLADETGTIAALEPSAGIGRFLEALSGDGFDALRWHACEYSRISGQLLTTLRRDVDVQIGPFEEWVQEHADLQGSLRLVVSNPPYGERGRAAFFDPDPFYREKRAYVYFLRRALDFLAPGGMGIFLVPAGFMTARSKNFVDLRTKVLLRHHLMAAFRLPSETEAGKPLFPGALLVTDILFFRARGGEATTLPEEDQGIVEGRYFEHNPSHILGREVGREANEDDHSHKPRFGYQVRGDFERIPDFEERPLCRDCEVKPFVVKKPKRPVALPDNVREALQLARRTSQYLSDVARGDAASLKRAAALHADLKEALLAWHAQPVEAKLPVTAALAVAPELQPLFTAMSERGQLLPALESPPAYMPQYVGTPDDILAQTTYLYSKQRSLTLEQLLALHKELNGPLDESMIRARLIAADWCFDGAALLPAQDYYSGALWARYDRAKAAANGGDAQAAAQAARLLEKIKPATYAEIQTEPRIGWLPIEVVQAFVNAYLRAKHYDSARYRLERVEGIVTLAGVPYTDIADSSRPLQELLGYINHDMTYFRPKVERNKDEDLEKKRQEQAQLYRDEWVNWLEGQPELQASIVEAFNRLFRGWEQPSYPPDDLEIARWNPKYPLYGYQNAGVRRLVAYHGGGLFFDVGLGKTRTMLAALALARQQGWARRAVIVIPGSVIWNWVAEIERVLPDFRYVLIGSKKKVVQRGPRKGQIESETDTPRERADKWQRFKAGLYDVALVTYSILPRTKMRIESLLSLIRQSPAIRREISLWMRGMEERIASLSKRKARLTEEGLAELERLSAKYSKMKPTERQVAIRAEREEALAQRHLTLPEGHEFDPDIVFEDLNIDWLAYDESHVGKNLWTVGAREGGTPRFLGAPQEGSELAWQMFYRAAIVRRNAGGAGVHLADATPAKNSPLEFLSLLSLIDDKVFERLGITDTEQYLTQYLKIEPKLIQDTDLTITEAPCVVGFQNLDQLREVLFRYGEFRTAKQVGLKIPEPKVYRIEVEMDAAQEAKYDQYLREYQQALESTSFDPDSRFKALGLLQRMALVAVHAELDEGPLEGKKAGWTFANASRANSYGSPKLDKIAELIAERKDCGHLVFLENNAAHYWLREQLVERGVLRERVAVLNGETASNTIVRQKIAEGFTAEEATYDVVIANKIAYEGLNLQNRTCAIYHGDLPWEPATLQQRNGRGQRQGNKYDVIDIYYVVSKRSLDMARFELIRGKREWMAALIESAASETNNPAAQVDMSPEDWLLWLSRDTERTQALIDAKKARQQEEENKKVKKLAWASVRAISVRQREVHNITDLFQRTRLMEEIARIAEELGAVDPDVWPWKFIIPHISLNPSLSFAPAHEGAIWQSARYRRISSQGDELDGAEFGRVIFTPRLGIGYRSIGSVMWEELPIEGAQQKWSYTRPVDWQTEWPPFEKEMDQGIREFLFQLRHEGVWIYRDARFDLASEAFLEALWKLQGEAILDALSLSRSAYQVRIPFVKEESLLIGGETEWRQAGRILPFTAAGFQEYLSLGRSSQLKWRDLEAAAEWWWGRHIPRNLLTDEKEAEVTLPRVAAA